MTSVRRFASWSSAREQGVGAVSPTDVRYRSARALPPAAAICFGLRRGASAILRVPRAATTVMVMPKTTTGTRTSHSPTPAYPVATARRPVSRAIAGRRAPSTMRMGSGTPCSTDNGCPNRRVADRCLPLFACLPRPTLKNKIVAARICVLPRSLTAQRSSVDLIICIARFGGQIRGNRAEQKAY